MLTGELFSRFESTQAIGDWGGRSLRTIVVGGPPVLALQQFTGGSRPGEQDYGSHWRPFQDDNGVSGHSFVGAVPFLSAAYMTDNRFRGSLIAASTLPAISRLNDDTHFASQAMIGWSLAFLAPQMPSTQPNRKKGHCDSESPRLTAILKWPSRTVGNDATGDSLQG